MNILKVNMQGRDFEPTF